MVSPMCQYNSDNGTANDWHLMHLGQFSLGAGALVMTGTNTYLGATIVSNGALFVNGALNGHSPHRR